MDHNGKSHIQILATQRQTCPTKNVKRKGLQKDLLEAFSDAPQLLGALLRFERGAETFLKKVCYREISSASSKVIVSLMDPTKQRRQTKWNGELLKEFKRQGRNVKKRRNKKHSKTSEPKFVTSTVYSSISYRYADLCRKL